MYKLPAGLWQWEQNQWRWASAAEAQMVLSQPQQVPTTGPWHNITELNPTEPATKSHKQNDIKFVYFL